MAKTSSLEAELTTITQEFVARIVTTIRNASFGDVASLSVQVAAPAKARPAVSISQTRRAPPALSPQPASDGKRKRRARQTADKRAELSEKVVQTLTAAREPLSARAIANALDVPLDLLTAPLLELRAAGRISKHGEKRSTTYTAA
jgi:predicted Rossmann fold nucleotide-binding protein DprA/Smf involved in DNA uptake